MKDKSRRLLRQSDRWHAPKNTLGRSYESSQKCSTFMWRAQSCLLEILTNRFQLATYSLVSVFGVWDTKTFLQRLMRPTQHFCTKQTSDLMADDNLLSARVPFERWAAITSIKCLYLRDLLRIDPRLRLHQSKHGVNKRIQKTARRCTDKEKAG